MTAGMPKIAICKDSDFISEQYDIRFSGQVLIILSIADSPMPQRFSQ